MRTVADPTRSPIDRLVRHLRRADALIDAGRDTRTVRVAEVVEGSGLLRPDGDRMRHRMERQASPAYVSVLADIADAARDLIDARGDGQTEVEWDVPIRSEGGACRAAREDWRPGLATTVTRGATPWREVDGAAR